MFTGLVEEVGECLWMKQTAQSVQITIVSKQISRGIRTGDSVAINGCCLTVASHRKEHLTFDALNETLRVTNLDKLRPQAPVNLERALAADGRLGGHFVQGHVDGTAGLLTKREKGTDLKLEIALPSRFARYVVSKGSIAVNGVSLTVAELSDSSFSVWVIPHTRKHTNLGTLAAGDTVNLEFDILAKYAERILGERPTPSQS